MLKPATRLQRQEAVEAAGARLVGESGAHLWSVEAADEVSGTVTFPADRRAFLILAERLLDAALVPIVWISCCLFAGISELQGVSVLALVSMLFAPYCFSAVGLYGPRTNRSPADVLLRLVLGWALVVGGLLVAGLVTGAMTVFPRRVLLSWVVVTPAILFAGHLGLVGLFVAYLQRRPIPAVIAGGGLSVRRVRRGLQCAGIDLAGVFDDALVRQGRCAGMPVLGGVVDVVDYVRREQVPFVFVSLPPDDPNLHSILDGLRDTTASIYYVPAVGVQHGSPIADGELDGQPVHALMETPFANPSARLLKRFSDCVIGGILLVLALPLMAIIALAVRLTSWGPILFRQRRNGVGGREIVIYKYRTMTVCEDGERVEQAQMNDPRVTRLGALLRRTSLDELPQLINVLQGRMSIVGPRPHAVAHNEHYRGLIPGYMQRHKVKPGITGWAQVHGLRGGTDTESMRRRVEHDLYYVHHWSFWLDFQILARTILIVIGQKSAY